jgi:hypothetical protein
MKKYSVLFFVVVGLGILAYFSATHKNSTLREKDTRFALEMPESVTKIRIFSNGGETILDRANNLWQANGEAGNQERIRDLLLISGLVEAVAPVSISQDDSVAKHLATGSHVSFYAGKRCTNSYRLCKWNNMIYAQKVPSNKSFRISVKGYPDIDLTKVFSPLPSDWACNILIDLRPDEIQQIKISYPAMNTKSFKLSVTGNASCQLLGSDSANLSEKVDWETVREYFSLFSKIRYTPLSDSMKRNFTATGNQQPFFILEITSMGQKPIRIEGFQKTDLQKKDKDPFRFYASTLEREIILLNYSDLDPILVTPGYFLKK